MLSISLNFKKGIDSLSETIHQPKIKKWLIWSLVAISLIGIGSYVGYNQLVTVPRQRAQNKIKTAAVTRLMAQCNPKVRSMSVPKPLVS
jgi:hypothetical protein